MIYKLLCQKFKQQIQYNRILFSIFYISCPLSNSMGNMHSSLVNQIALFLRGNGKNINIHLNIIKMHFPVYISYFPVLCFQFSIPKYSFCVFFYRCYTYFKSTLLKSFHDFNMPPFLNHTNSHVANTDSLLISLQFSRINWELRAFSNLLLRISKPTRVLQTCYEDIINNQGDLLQKR